MEINPKSWFKHYLCFAGGWLAFEIIGHLLNFYLQLVGMAMFACVLVAFNWERNQYLFSGMSFKAYFSAYWLETIMDFISGIAGFLSVYWIRITFF